MLAVSDTSPLLNLAIIGRVAIVRPQFERVLVPPAVLAELDPQADRLGSSDLRAALADGWLVPADPARPLTRRELRTRLHAGEAEALSLAVERGVETVLVDEERGRKAALRLGLVPVGVLGLLLGAKACGALDAVAPALAAVEREAGFYLSPELRAEMLARAGEA